MVTECTFGQLKGRWRLLYRKSGVNQHSLKMSVLACIVLHNICIEKTKDRINHNLGLTFDENNKRKSSEDIRRNLKMVSGLNTAYTSEGGASLGNDICEYLWFKKQYYEDC